MAEQTDMQLMQEYTDSRSESAFAQLTQRHLNLVYSVALRYAGNAHDAQDIAQAVFVILVRKIPALRQRATLTGWLYETTRLTSRQLLRRRTRQQKRDQEAFMQSALDQPVADSVWQQLAPHLEAAVSHLAELDRTLLALRFYENKTGAEAAALLGIGEQAAHKRTARALEKLRKFFNRRGVALTAALIAAALSANAVQAAPATLVTPITVAATKEAAIGVSVASLVQAALKSLFWVKCRTSLGFAAAILVVCGMAVIIVSAKNNSPKPLAASADAGAPPAESNSPATVVIREPLNDGMKFALGSPPGGLAVQADGKIVVGSVMYGWFVDDSSGSVGVFTRGAFRLNPDGSLDRSFFSDVRVPSSAAQMAHVDCLPDDRLFLTGLFGAVDGQLRPNYAMLLPNGSLDKSFVPWRSNSNQPPPFFLPRVAGPTFWKLTSYQGGVMPATWLPDNTVAIACSSTLTSTNPNYSPLTSYRLDASGRWIPPAKISRPIIAPLDTLGPTGFWPRLPVNWARETVDTNLPWNQRYSTMPGGEAAGILSALFAEMPIELCRYAVKLPDGGAILAVAGTGSVDDHRIGPGKLMRFDKNWRPDFSFTNRDDARGYLNIKRQKDGKILVAGIYGTLNGEDFTGLMRLNEDGSTDRSFHCETANTMEGRVMDMAIQDDGRIVICGFFTSVNGVDVPYLARINPDGSLDQTFHPSFTTMDRWNKDLREKRRVAVAKLHKTQAPAPTPAAAATPATAVAPTASASSSVAASAPETILITLMQMDATGARIEFTGVGGRQYFLQANDSVQSPYWNTIATNQAAANGNGIFHDSDTANHPTRFYRIATP